MSRSRRGGYNPGGNAGAEGVLGCLLLLAVPLGAIVALAVICGAIWLMVPA